jgi:hypothetical protein
VGVCMCRTAFEPLDATASTLDATASTLDATASTLDATASTLDATASTQGHHTRTHVCTNNTSINIFIYTHAFAQERICLKMLRKKTHAFK